MSTANFSHFQVGQNANPAQNFTVTQGADGSGKIARGNQGATTQDIITWDGAGKVTVPNVTLTQQDGLPTYACRAWASFSGTATGTNAPTAGGNVTSVTRNAAGSYTINFTTAMPDVNYSVVGSATNDSSGSNIPVGFSVNNGQTTSAVTIRINDSTAAGIDRAVVNFAAFR